MTSNVLLEGLCNLISEVLVIHNFVCNLFLLRKLHAGLTHLAFGALQCFRLAVEEVANVGLIRSQKQPLAVLMRQALSKLEPFLDQW